MTAPAPEMPPRKRRTGWISAHIFHAGDLDALITQMVAPLVTDLNPDGFFFLRYWEGGPHLRLRLLGSHPDQARHVKHELTRRAREHLNAHPSSRTLTPAQYEAMGSQQARAERLPAHDGRLHPNDTVEFIAYRPEHHAFGNPACMAAVERHFTESSRLALDTLSGHPGPGRRAAIALAALTLTLAACQADPRRMRLDPPPAIRDIYDARREDLRRQTRHLWTAAPGGPLGTWSHSIHTLRRALTDAGCAPEDADSPLGFLAHAAPPEHRPVAEVLLRCTHLLNNRIGLTPTAENRVGMLTAHILHDLSAIGDIT
ncbi:thiopeptide-type bacteriocin biosynthesis protein [Actinoallomurus purpureus]|uniref:thiopeptide-type bacteriocin biosynthesis protein n=1 Tax=Actinoallomurus purpureus TaxID=478114 RepID=UPI002093013E|nr:thiopeptide-type bacteriocin biosynthesis protein [Actinoallomurus purpureus]MCO6006964.1 thiopeptide-type bacteriocin biosynthesis protein [Actinoallomurus purpureus]